MLNNLRYKIRVALADRALFWLSGFLPCRLIEIDGVPYLERYYLGQVFGVTCYLHRFVSSDSERHVHNHPWKRGGSLIICGSYEETNVLDLCPWGGPSGCITRQIRRRAGSFHRVNGNTFHQIGQAEAGTWTLFVHGHRPTGKGWGFLERRDLKDDTVTVFSPYLSSSSQWWKFAPKGADAEREPRK